MTKSEIASMAKSNDLAGVRATLDDCRDLQTHPGFHAFEKRLINELDRLYEEVVKGGLPEGPTDYLRGQIYAIKQILGLADENIGIAENFVDRPVQLSVEDNAAMDDFVERRYMNKGE